jgi:hypothetical protein
LQANPLLQYKTKRYDREGDQSMMLISFSKVVIEQEEIHATKNIQEMNPLLMMRNALESLAVVRNPSRHNRQKRCS